MVFQLISMINLFALLSLGVCLWMFVFRLKRNNILLKLKTICFLFLNKTILRKYGNNSAKCLRCGLPVQSSVRVKIYQQQQKDSRQKIVAGNLLLIDSVVHFLAALCSYWHRINSAKNLNYLFNVVSRNAFKPKEI